MPFPGSLLRNHPELKRALITVAKRLGILRDNPVDAFYRDVRKVSDRGGDEVSALFYGYAGERPIHKWNHCLPIYDRLFGPYRAGMPDGRPLRFLEIGVFDGGSLELWRRYFGADAIITGIDIDPRCAAFDGKAGRVRIGSQADPDFLKSVVREMGGVDLVLDDGSHVAEHQRVSFETLFPLLSADGLYVAEDLHTAYWREWQGGYRRRGTFIELTKGYVDDMHAWYHGRAASELGRGIGEIRIFDSLIAFGKGSGTRPFHTSVGGPGG